MGTQIPEDLPQVTYRQLSLSEQQHHHRFLKPEFVDPAWLDISDQTGPFAVSESTKPQLPNTTTHDGEQDEQQATLQQPEEYSRDQQIEQDNDTPDVDHASSIPERHTSSSTAESIPSFQCEHCPRVFKSVGPLNKHIKTHTRPYKCSMPGCDVGCPTQKELERHKQSVHKDQVPLGRHMAYCPYNRCDRSANGRKGAMRQDNLQRHINTKHRLGF